jgi:Trk K+ transport system NAD-binding subunit
MTIDRTEIRLAEARSAVQCATVLLGDERTKRILAEIDAADAELAEGRKIR